MAKKAHHDQKMSGYNPWIRFLTLHPHDFLWNRLRRIGVRRKTLVPVPGHALSIGVNAAQRRKIIMMKKATDFAAWLCIAVGGNEQSSLKGLRGISPEAISRNIASRGLFIQDSRNKYNPMLKWTPNDPKRNEFFPRTNCIFWSGWMICCDSSDFFFFYNIQRKTCMSATIVYQKCPRCQEPWRIGNSYRDMNAIRRSYL